MTDEQARRTANVVLGLAAAGAAYYVLRTPPLRRMAWQIARTALTGSVPVWLGGELRRAWQESGRGRPPFAAVNRAHPMAAPQAAARTQAEREII